jgi:hypothetical protein
MIIVHPYAGFTTNSPIRTTSRLEEKATYGGPEDAGNAEDGGAVAQGMAQWNQDRAYPQADDCDQEPANPLVVGSSPTRGAV